MFEKLSDNLNLLMAKERLNSSELARITKLPASTIKKIRNGDNINPTLTTLLPLAQYFSITLSQLVGEESIPEMIARPNLGKMSEQSIPIITWEDAVTWPEAHHPSYSFITVKNIYGENTYALYIEEEDLEYLTKDTLLIIDPSSKAEHRDLVIVYKKGQKVPTIKRILYDEGQAYLKPIAPGYTITALTPEHKILGVLMEYRKEVKKCNDR